MRHSTDQVHDGAGRKLHHGTGEPTKYSSIVVRPAVDLLLQVAELRMEVEHLQQQETHFPVLEACLRTPVVAGGRFAHAIRHDDVDDQLHVNVLDTKWQPRNWVLLVPEDAAAKEITIGAHHPSHHWGGDAVLHRLFTILLLENHPQYRTTKEGAHGHQKTGFEQHASVSSHQ